VDNFEENDLIEKFEAAVTRDDDVELKLPKKRQPPSPKKKGPNELALIKQYMED
jgi:hypothetical protein